MVYGGFCGGFGSGGGLERKRKRERERVNINVICFFFCGLCWVLWCFCRLVVEAHGGICGGGGGL